MATFFKSLGVNDRVVSTTALESELKLTFSDLATGVDKTFYKNYALVSSPSTNTYGISDISITFCSTGSAATTTSQNIYKQLSHQLLGYNESNALITFKDKVSTLEDACVIFIPRSSGKDKLLPGSVELGLVGYANTLIDYTSSMTECQTGFYSPLRTSDTPDDNPNIGLVFYEAGVIIIDKATINLGSGTTVATSDTPVVGAESIKTNITSVKSKAVTELNSTIYFCRAYNNEFNYSSNPTYLDDNCQIRVKMDDPMTEPHAYITTVGLYNDKQELLAVGKFSQPIKKSPQTELIARVRLDF